MKEAMIRPQGMGKYTNCLTEQGQADLQVVELSSSQVQTLARLPVEFPAVLDDAGTIALAAMDPIVIQLKDGCRPPFIDHGGPLLSPANVAVVTAQVSSWLRDGVVEPSESANRTYLLVASSSKGNHGSALRSWR